MSELKPCPFCGDNRAVHIESKTFGFYVFCVKCRAKTDHGANKGAATRAWNRRADNER